MKRTTRTSLAVVLILALVMGLAPVVSAADGFTTVEPVLVVTGSGTDLADEKAYTMDELKALAGDDCYYKYSALNRFNNTTYYAAAGIALADLLSDSADLSKDVVAVLAASGYSAQFDPAGPELNGAGVNAETGEIDKDANGNGVAGGFLLERYAFESLDSTAGTAVPTILAWSNEQADAYSQIPEAVEDMDYLRLMTGQVSTADMNAPLFNGKSDDPACIVLVGTYDDTPVLTVGDTGLTRADVLLLPRAERSYTYGTSSGDTTVYAQGVPLSVLLADYADTDTFTITCADGYECKATGMSKAELVAGNYMLGYAKGADAASLEAIMDTAKDDEGIVGYFTLYGDDFKATKLVNQIVPVAAGLESEISVTVDGEEVVWTDAVPFIDSNNRTLVPLRAVAEALGLEVSWDAAARQAVFCATPAEGEEPVVNEAGAVVTKAELVFTIDSQTLLGRVYFEDTAGVVTPVEAEDAMDTAAVIKDSRTYAPVRYLAEFYGLTVGWDAATKTVLITSAEPVAE